MTNPPFKSQLRLIIQTSIPIHNVADGVSEYENLKVFLQAISPDITLNGQIIKPLEPCCKKPQEKPTAKPGIHDFSPTNPAGGKKS